MSATATTIIRRMTVRIWFDGDWDKVPLVFSLFSLLQRKIQCLVLNILRSPKSHSGKISGAKGPKFGLRPPITSDKSTNPRNKSCVSTPPTRNCDIMKLDEVPREIFEMVIESVSFVDLPYLLQVSKGIHVSLKSFFSLTLGPVWKHDLFPLTPIYGWTARLEVHPHSNEWFSESLEVLVFT